MVFLDDVPEMVRGESITERIPQEVNLKVFKEKIEQFYDDVLVAFSDIPNEKKGFKLDEITVNVEIGVEGKVGFLGSGVGGSAKAGISFKLKRQ